MAVPFAVSVSRNPADLQLLDAVRRNDIGQATLLLSSGANASSWVPSGWQCEDFPAEPEITDRRCMLIAAASTSLDMFQLLHKAGAPLDAPLVNTTTSATLLRVSLANRRFQMALWLLQHGATVDAMTLKATCEYCDILRQEDVAMAHARRNADDALNEIRSTIRNLTIQRAVENGVKLPGKHFETMGARMPVLELLEKGLLACPTQEDAASLLKAFDVTDEELAENVSFITPQNMPQLIALKLDQVSIGHEPGTLWHLIVRKMVSMGDKTLKPFFQAIGERGVSLSFDERAGPDATTPLMIAAEAACPQVLQDLLKNGADVNAEDVYCRPALWYALQAVAKDASRKLPMDATSKSCQCLRYLLHYGAQTNVLAANETQKYMLSPMHIAFACGKYNIVDLLVRYGGHLIPTTNPSECPFRFIGAFSAASRREMIDMMLEDDTLESKLPPNLVPLFAANPRAVLESVIPAETVPLEAKRQLIDRSIASYLKHDGSWYRRKEAFMAWSRTPMKI
jgi:hypothetical protein